MLERKGDVAGREVGKMRQGREGLLSGRGPFAGVWGPFCRKGGLSSMDFCLIFPKLCPGGSSRWRGGVPWPAISPRGCKGGEGGRGMQRGYGQGGDRISRAGVAAGGLGLQGRVTVGCGLRLCRRRKKYKKPGKKTTPRHHPWHRTPPPRPHHSPHRLPQPPRAAPCVGTTDPRF